MPVSKKRKKNGQRESAGRFAFAHAGSQALAMRMMARVFLLAAVLILGASSISDPVQALVQQGVEESLHKLQLDTVDSTLAMRAALLRHTAAKPDAVRHLSRNELLVVFGKPTLQRAEGDVNIWQFASSDCALDIYFKDDANKPVYAEYRVRGSAEGGAKP
ncbi:MAG TPA: hypothetical protein VIN59_03265, partial [Alphaproteobacteria bacterium]